MDLPALNITADFFSLLNLPQRQALDSVQLETNFRELQARVHPDRHVRASDADQRLAMQWASRVNEAFQTLREPLRRANYLLGLKGHDSGLESNTAMPVEFLMAQMELRESVADARESGNEAALDIFRDEIAVEMKFEYAQLEALIDEQADFPSATNLVRQLMFQQKLLSEIDDALAAVVD
ncbi:MAG: Fe-S protein assembly co-chaperone HscB [Rhodocyclaceae bacterium]|nr:Fe-S protein assembly co-chaperone HscB [Rhodocyclaceae bacterium]